MCQMFNLLLEAYDGVKTSSFFDSRSCFEVTSSYYNYYNCFNCWIVKNIYKQMLVEFIDVLEINNGDGDGNTS